MTDQEAADLARLGVPAQAIEADRQARGRAAAAQAFVLAAHLWPVVHLFDCMGTQWRTVATPRRGLVRTGLDYGAVKSTARMAGLKRRELTPRTFRHLRLMEDEALLAQAERLTAAAAREGAR